MKEIRIACKERRISGGRFSPLLGTLRSDNGDVHENVHEKWTSHPFTFFRDYPKSPSYLRRREFRLEMKRGQGARPQTEMVEFLGLPFPFSSKLKLWSFHVVVFDGNEMYKTASRTCRVVALLIKLLRYCIFDVPVAVMVVFSYRRKHVSVRRPRLQRTCIYIFHYRFQWMSRQFFSTEVLLQGRKLIFKRPKGSRKLASPRADFWLDNWETN